ncbi:hypothetical protein HK102_004607 [Quaeritorhiza haematococci]|nr:hypothetical protein HK102_004607 [Quaeritorhiza haematococci]
MYVLRKAFEADRNCASLLIKSLHDDSNPQWRGKKLVLLIYMMMLTLDQGIQVGLSVPEQTNHLYLAFDHASEQLKLTAFRIVCHMTVDRDSLQTSRLFFKKLILRSLNSPTFTTMNSQERFAALVRLYLKKVGSLGGKDERDQLMGWLVATLTMRLDVRSHFHVQSCAIRLIKLVMEYKDVVSEMVDVRLIQQVLKFVIDSPFEISRQQALAVLDTAFNPSDSEFSTLWDQAVALSNNEKTLSRLRATALWKFLNGTKREEKESHPEVLSFLSSQLNEQVNFANNDILNALSNGKPQSLHFPEPSPTRGYAVRAATKDVHAIVFRVLDLCIEFFLKVQFEVSEDPREIGIEGESNGDGDNAEETGAGGAEDDDDQTEDAMASPRALGISAAWRSLKSCCDLFPLLVRLRTSKASIKMRTDDKPTTDETRALVEKIFKYCKKILLEVRHWGVATWTHRALQDVCSVLYAADENIFQQLPTDLLEDACSSLASDLTERHDQRYAGLSRIILAVINGCPHEAMLKRRMLDRVFSTFVNAALPSSSAVNDETAQRQVNALNVISWIVNDHRVYSLVPLEDIFVLSLDCLQLTNRPLRSAASFLFTTLMKRTFGLHRITQVDKASVPVTASDFFIRYPKLKERVLSVVADAQVDRNQSFISAVPSLHTSRPGTNLKRFFSPSLQIVLTLLSRFNVIATREQFDEGMSFLSMGVAEIAVRSPIWKIREMASVAYSKLIPTMEVHKELIQIVMRIPAKVQDKQGPESLSMNNIHGTLLLALHSISSHGHGVTGELYLHIESCRWLLQASCFPVRTAYLALLKLVLSEMQQHAPHERTFMDLLYTPKHFISHDIGITLYKRDVAKLRCELYSSSRQATSVDFYFRSILLEIEDDEFIVGAVDWVSENMNRIG